MKLRKKTISEEFDNINKLFNCFNININLLTEGDGSKGLLGVLGSKSIDNLAKSGIDAAADLSKLSDEFVTLTGKQNPTMDDFLKIVGDGLGKNVDELTEAEVEAFVKNNEKLYDSILKKAADEAGKIVDNLMKNLSLKTLFDDAGIPQVYDNLKALVSTVPTKRNVAILEKDIDNHIAFVKDLLDDNPGNKDLEEMLAQLTGKKEDCVKFKGGSVSLSPNIAKLFADTKLIISAAKELGITVTDEMITGLKNFANDLGDVLFGKLLDDAQLIPVGGPMPKGNMWEKLEPYYRLDYSSGKKSFWDHYDRASSSLGKNGSWWGKNGLKFFSAILGMVLLFIIYKWLTSGEALKDLKETTKEFYDYATTPDSTTVDCAQKILGYNELTDDQKTYVALYVNCDENCVGFSKIDDTKVQIAFKGTPTCLETHIVNKGGLSGGKQSGGDCKGTSYDNTTTKKYTCKNNECVEDPNGEFNEATCGGSCGGSNKEEDEKETTVEYKNTADGFQSWCSDKGYTDCDYNGLWYKDKNGADKQATYSDGTFN